MTENTWLLLFALLSISAARFHCPDNCLCTLAYGSDPRNHQIYCSTDDSLEAGFNITLLSANYANVECQNFPDWNYFESNGGLIIDFRNVDSLVFSGCQIPNIESNNNVVQTLFGNVWVKSLTIDALKGNLSKRYLDVFPYLKALVLSNNYLGKVDEDLLYGLHNLTKLHLQRTKIQIPIGFFAKSRSLKHLDLRDNALCNLEPGLFNGLESLTSLNLCFNNFEFIQPKLFRGLTSLKFIDISNNHLLALPNDIFQDTSNLTSVKLNGNKFISIPTNLFTSGKLKYVKLADNELDLAQLPSRLFSDLIDLKVVSLEHLGLRELSNDLFWGSSDLIELNLKNNLVEELPDDLLKDARELRKLDVSSNKLKALPDKFFVNTNRLMKLDLSDNEIVTLSASFSNGLVSLLEINLSDNKLQVLHADTFIFLRNLKLAKLSRNRLNLRNNFSESNQHLSAFRHCGRLEELDLSRNEIAELSSDWIANHNWLRKLDLSYNHFSYVETNDFEFTSNRLFINLSHNKIAVVNLSSHNSLLKSTIKIYDHQIMIDLDDNPIDCYCEVYPLHRYALASSSFKSHVQLQMEKLECSNPMNLQGLRLTELNDTKLECTLSNGHSNSCVSDGICDCWIVPVDRKLSFNCSQRHLMEAPIWINTRDDNLRVSVDLSGNYLTRVPNMRRNGYGRVQSLNLANNRIDCIDDNLISPMLQNLHLEHNNLVRIDTRVFTRLTKSVTSLWLRGNHWLCDDTALEFRRFVQDHKFDVIKDYREVLCDDETHSPLWQKPLSICESLELFLRGIGAFLLSLIIFAVFFAILVYVLVQFLKLTARASNKSELYSYDAFVSYCDEDISFVKNELAAKLENNEQKAYRLYIHERDRSRIDVTDIMERSKRVIVVLSRDFFDYRSRLRLEYERARDSGNRMIFVVRGKIEDRLCEALRAMTLTHEWIEWSDGCFWKKLREAMGD